METGGPKLGSESQESNDFPAAGISGHGRPLIKFSTTDNKVIKNVPLTPKGVENAKKRLRAFSIQKKSSLSPVPVAKPISSGGATVFIGKLTSVKTLPKVEPDPLAEVKKIPKPRKPGSKQTQESYISNQKKMLAEIEDMKRQMELVELGIPLGLICPSPNSDKAMPTKAMPPIKSFIDPSKVDELIREAKKAKAEGKEFKFDYHKLLPDYDNPFQRKKGEDVYAEPRNEEQEQKKAIEKDKRRSEKYEFRRHFPQKRIDKDRYKDDKYRDRPREKERDADRSKYRESKPKEREVKEQRKSKDRDRLPSERDKKEAGEIKKLEEEETNVDLKDFVVCDSWSDNEEKSKDSSNKIEEKPAKEMTPLPTSIDPMDQLKQVLGKQNKPESPKPKLKLKPVIDSFKYEIEDSEDDDILDIFDEKSSTNKYAKVKSKKSKLYDSPVDVKLFDFETKDAILDDMADDTFLESVINEIKQEEMDETSQDKALVEYDESPSKDGELRDSVTPEMDERLKEIHSSRSDYSDGYKSTESCGKSVESGYRSNDSLKLSEYKSDCDVELGESKLAKYTVDSLETWSFVLKICQPLLFRHDKNKCYRETRMTPKVWFTENPKLCNCVKDRRVVYEELEMCKMDLVDNLYSTHQVTEAAYPTARGWYPRLEQCLAETNPVQLCSEWEAEDSQTEQRTMTPERGARQLDQEYQRFMEAVWPDVVEPSSETPRSTPVRSDRKRSDDDLDKPKTKKMKLSSEGWSQESDLEEEVDKSSSRKMKLDKQKRKRKHSSSTLTDSSEGEAKKRKKMQKKKDSKKSKSKESKRRRVIKKGMKKLKEKQKKKKKVIRLDADSDVQDLDKAKEKEKKKKEKKLKKKKQLKLKKKNQKKKKSKAKSSSSSDSSSESEAEKKSKSKKKSEKRKKRKKSSSESTQEELFDVNILNNIKKEKTDDEKNKQLDFSPRRQKPREIINVKELQNDFVGNIQIKLEVDDRYAEESEKRREQERVAEEKRIDEEKEEQMTVEDKKEEQVRVEERTVEEKKEQSVREEVFEKQEESQESQKVEVSEKEQQSLFKEPEEPQPTPQMEPRPDENSQCSSQESVYSLKDQPTYEKDESHLRPSSQNSNYSFHDVMASGHHKHGMDGMGHGMEHSMEHGMDMQRHMDMEGQEYEQGNYEMYEQMAMAYQSDVASQLSSPGPRTEHRIETVVHTRSRGEIKCDWRAGRDSAATTPLTITRWGQKPSEVNIVLTGGNDQYPIRNVVEPVYKIQSLANRSDNCATDYDEAYMDTYGALDRLQYGDCFSSGTDSADRRSALTVAKLTSSLDDRIDLALRTTVLGEVAKVPEDADEKDGPEKGILVTKPAPASEPRATKRVSFADGYKPGQDSDVEEPPVRKKKKLRRVGCAWPCPASHADHVPLWDALPPPPPPPGSPPPPAQPPLPPHAAGLLRQPRPHHNLLPMPPHPMAKFDPNVMPAFMPPEPPPGLISFQNL